MFFLSRWVSNPTTDCIWQVDYSMLFLLKLHFYRKTRKRKSVRGNMESWVFDLWIAEEVSSSTKWRCRKVSQVNSFPRLELSNSGEVWVPSLLFADYQPHLRNYRLSFSTHAFLWRFFNCIQHSTLSYLNFLIIFFRIVKATQKKKKRNVLPSP